MSTLVQITVAPRELEDKSLIFKKALQKSKIAPSQITDWNIRKRSIDARQKNIKFNLQIELWKEGEKRESRQRFEVNDVSNAPKLAIIGAGARWFICSLACYRRRIETSDL